MGLPLASVLARSVSRFSTCSTRAKKDRWYPASSRFHARRAARCWWSPQVAARSATSASRAAAVTHAVRWRLAREDMVADPGDDGSRPDPRAHRLRRVPEEEGAPGGIPPVQRLLGGPVRFGAGRAPPDQAVRDGLEGMGLVDDAAQGVGELGIGDAIQNDGGDGDLPGEGFAGGL